MSGNNEIDLDALEQAANLAEKQGQRIYTHPRDSKKWRENEKFIEQCSPEIILELIRRLREAERGAENLRNALSEYANPLNWGEDQQGIRRVWLEPDTTTPEAYNGYELARKETNNG
jgi:hypothetical protein